MVGASQRVDSSTDNVLGAREDASKQGRKIAAIDANEGIILVDEELDEEEVAMDAESQERLNQKDVNAASKGKLHDEKFKKLQLERLNQKDVNAASKGVSVVSAPKLVSAAEPTVSDDEDVTMTMAQALIKLKAEKAKILDE
nr:hypothetical protein [Tanacetum cinerariifolium]